MTKLKSFSYAFYCYALCSLGIPGHFGFALVYASLVYAATRATSIFAD